MKIKIDGVAETLLITLYMRASDAMSKKPILNDKKSLEIMKQIEYDFDKFKNSKASFFGTMARIRVMDTKVKEFITKNPKCNIISVGCGLDTRFERVDNGQILWYNLDFPEVIEMRKNFFKENKRVVNIAKSALDRTWTDDLIKNSEPLLIVSEGVLMYLKEDEIRDFLNILTSSFSSFEAHFDLCHQYIVKKSSSHDTVKYMNAEFNFGVTDGHEIVELNPKLKQLDIINFTDEMSKFKLGTLRFFLPMIRRYNNRLGIYEYRG